MGGCQNHGPFLDPYYNTADILRVPKRDHNFDNHPYDANRMLTWQQELKGCIVKVG